MSACIWQQDRELKKDVQRLVRSAKKMKLRMEGVKDRCVCVKESHILLNHPSCERAEIRQLQR